MSHRRPLPHPLLAAAVLGPVLLGCRSLAPPPPEEAGARELSARGVDHPTLARLCADAWEAKLAADPFWATYLGEPRFHGDVPDVSRAGRERRLGELRELFSRARLLKDEELNEEDRLTLALVLDDVQRDLRRTSAALDEWTVDPVSSLTSELFNLASVQPVGTAHERSGMMERWNALPGYVRKRTENLRLAFREGRVATRGAISKALDQVDAVLDTPPMDSPLVEPALGGGEWVELPPGGSLSKLALEHLGSGQEQPVLRKLNPHLREGERVLQGTRVLLPPPGDPLSHEERGEFLYELLTTVERGIYPALAAHRDALAEELLPGARPDGEPGLVHLFRGEALYRSAILDHTTLPLSAEEVHALGRDEVARIRAEIAALGRRHFGTGSVEEVQRRLRTDPDLFFDTRAGVQAVAEEALLRANRHLDGYFGIRPVAACDVLPTPRHEEEDSTIAYYRQPSLDGERPGRYYVNTYAPETRPRYEAEVLAYHEAVPGHHLQIAIAQELDDLPAIRRNAFHTAYGEGWALYIERLADEMGLYSGDLDRFGVLSFDAWRACRLVVDTGIHALGWSREQAVDYLYDNTLLARNNCENEVDRYIAWPGQALAYKIGQREILRLRDLAREELGEDFRYPDFHDRVLEKGSLPLPLLAERIERWIAANAP